MFSEFFIRRPIFATVLSIVIMLAGGLSLKALPIEQFPDIVPPVVNVSATYPGASAEVVSNTVAAPLEQAINGVDDMLYIQSTSNSSGALSLSVTFKIGTDADEATINVNNRVQSALSGIPEEVRRQGVDVRKRSNSFLQVISVFSPDQSHDTLFLSNYATLNLVDALKRVDGVGEVQNFAAQDYAMRIWMRPDKMAQLSVNTSDVAAAIREQNAQFAAGKIGALPTKDRLDFTYTVTTQGRMSEPSEFENIIIRSNPDGSKILLKDIARLELGALSYDFKGEHNGRPTVPVGIFLAPGANQVATADAVRATLDEMSKTFPAGVEYGIPYDTTKFVNASIKEVVKTFIEALILVFLVVYLFLQNWRATLIPCIAVPVSIIGTFAVMYLLGFTINTLTLFGLVLAIGIVVDDAIVVLENVERIMRTEGLNALDASIKAMREVAGALVAIVLVLAAVFVPVAFIGGIAGEMYKQFAITIAVSVAISGLVALTLTPALCAVFLDEHDDEKKPNRFFQGFNNFFDRATHKYTAGVRFFVKRMLLGFGVLAAVCVASWGLVGQIPSSLAPEEDQGFVFGATMLPEGTNLERTHDAMQKLDKILVENDNIEEVMSFSGFDILSGGAKSSSGVSFIILKDWGSRAGQENSSFGVIGSLFGATAGLRDSFTLFLNPPPISGMSNTGGFEGYVQSRESASPEALSRVMNDFVAAAAQRPELQGVQTTFTANVPQISVELDREKARALGVPITDVFDTMQSMFGSLYVNDFNKFGRVYKVQMQSEADYRARVSDIGNMYVRSSGGQMVPLTALVNVKRTVGPEIMERFNVFTAGKIMGNPAPGYSSGEALDAMEALAADVLPEGYALAWSGSAFQEKSTQGSTVVVFAFGLLMVFLILAAQYERWTLPIAVLLAVPFALFGALLANWMRGLQFDIYFQVALVTLIGLAAKNAILIVEFAVQQMEDEGKNVWEASIEAARLRFRPIVMTSLAFMMGVLPLAISSGAGSASRHSIGTGVIGGMLAATFIAIIFVPMFFVFIMTLGKKGKGKDKDSREDKEPTSINGEGV
ncbi:efflux RND transporter permease subunit [Neisseriaceae bacterium CLB008]|nr:multidrug efflux RND transporter permease subunit [Neisseriaceae bacterium]